MAYDKENYDEERMKSVCVSPGNSAGGGSDFIEIDLVPDEDLSYKEKPCQDENIFWIDDDTSQSCA